MTTITLEGNHLEPLVYEIKGVPSKRETVDRRCADMILSVTPCFDVPLTILVRLQTDGTWEVWTQKWQNFGGGGYIQIDDRSATTIEFNHAEIGDRPEDGTFNTKSDGQCYFARHDRFELLPFPTEAQQRTVLGWFSEKLFNCTPAAQVQIWAHAGLGMTELARKFNVEKPSFLCS